jgi:TorA maturation chaperone TorD
LSAPDPEAALYALLGRLFAAEIDAEFLAVLKGTPELLAVFETIAPGCLDIDLEEAATEYCRLFVLPRGVPAVASAWLPGSDPNRAAPIVGLVYNLKSTLELSLPAELPPDHAGVLLPLMAWLLDKQPEAAADFQIVALNPWLEAFANALAEKAQLPVYRAIAKILKSI